MAVQANNLGVDAEADAGGVNAKCRRMQTVWDAFIIGKQIYRSSSLQLRFFKFCMVMCYVSLRF
jgi:hypothetical protein